MGEEDVEQDVEQEQGGEQGEQEAEQEQEVVEQRLEQEQEVVEQEEQEQGEEQGVEYAMMTTTTTTTTTTTKKRMKAKGVDDVANALPPILLLGKEDAHRLYADSLTRFLTESGLMKGKGERYMKPGGDTWKKRCSECEKEMYFGGK